MNKEISKQIGRKIVACLLLPTVLSSSNSTSFTQNRLISPVNQQLNTIEIIKDYYPKKAEGLVRTVFLNVDNDQVRQEWKYFDGELKKIGAKETSWHRWRDDKGAGWEDTHAVLTNFNGYCNNKHITPLSLGGGKLWGKFIPSQNCNLQLEVSNAIINTFSLKAGEEYEIWINHTKLWLRHFNTEKIKYSFTSISNNKEIEIFLLKDFFFDIDRDKVIKRLKENDNQLKKHE